MAEKLAVEVDVKNLASEDTLGPFSVALVNGNGSSVTDDN